MAWVLKNQVLIASPTCWEYATPEDYPNIPEPCIPILVDKEAVEKGAAVARKNERLGLVEVRIIDEKKFREIMRKWFRIWALAQKLGANAVLRCREKCLENEKYSDCLLECLTTT